MSSRHLLIVAVVGLFVSAAHADTIYVDADNCPGPGDGSELNPYCSIQTAIDNAVDTDEIVVAPGTYFETINFMGKAVWLHSSDGADVTIIDATDLGEVSVVTCATGEGPDTVLEGFTVTGGEGTGCVPSCPTVGGGMHNDNSSPTVTHCIFSGNSAAWGGGMANSYSSPTVTDCTFSGNSAASGGAMLNDGSNPILTGCSFTGNFAEAPKPWGRGGGILNRNGSNPMVTDCTFDGNQSVDGGGMYSDDSSPTVTDCTFSGNSANFGGGMYNYLGSPAVINCTFSENEAAISGGGMLTRCSTPTVRRP
jgi:hypothetical protein